MLPRMHVLDGVEEVRGELLEVLRALLKDVEEARADAALRLGEELGRLRAVHRVGRQEGVPRAEVQLVLLPHRVARRVEPGQPRDGHNTANEHTIWNIIDWSEKFCIGNRAVALLTPRRKVQSDNNPISKLKFSVTCD